MSFEEDVEHSIRCYEKANARAAARTRQMIAERGADQALSYLVKSPELQQGFKVLRDSGQLDATFEAVIIRHRERFREDEDAIKAAEWRLDHPYDLL
jgi:hypothetical protein